MSGSSTTIDGGDNFAFGLGTQSFAGGSGSAIFTYTNLSDSAGSITTDAKLAFTVFPINKDGVIATHLVHAADIVDNGTGQHVIGAGTAPRADLGH